MWCTLATSTFAGVIRCVIENTRQKKRGLFVERLHRAALGLGEIWTFGLLE